MRSMWKRQARWALNPRAALEGLWWTWRGSTLCLVGVDATLAVVALIYQHLEGTPGPEAEAETEPEAEAEAEPEAEPKAEPEAEPEAEAKPEAEHSGFLVRQGHRPQCEIDTGLR